MSRIDGQATKRKNPPKKGSKRQNYSSNAPQARAKRGPVRAPRNQTSSMAAAYGSTVVSRGPKISTKLKSWVISNQEMIGPVVLPNLTTNYSFQNIMRLRCNPASSVTFPWLSNLATSFENYRFKRLRFYVITRLSSQDRGTVLLSPDYDAADGAAAPVESWYFANRDTVDAPVWKPEVSLRMDPVKMNQRYKTHVCMSDTRFASTVQDEKTIDVAQVNVASDLTYTTANFGMIGKLMVDYEVELLIPQQSTESTPSGTAVGPLTATFLSTDFTKLFKQNLVSAGGPIYQEASNPVIQFDPTKFVGGIVAVTGNTPVLGQLMKDYTGQFTAQYADNYSSTYSGAGRLVTSNDASNTISPGDLAATFVPYLSSITSNVANTITFVNDVFEFSGKAGQILKYIPTTNGPSVASPGLSISLAQLGLPNDFGLV